ncbi:MAG: DUF3168 domain-containing protein [Sphingomonadales bacterium]|nr:MAG: DUF3168 domain-containing protein [Sphingomonadales bacterium]
MENDLRTALVNWLRIHPSLDQLNAVEEESPLNAVEPWLGIAASASTDWSTKDRAGREVRVALELATYGDDPATEAQLAAAAGQAIEALPKAQAGFDIISTIFLRARTQRRTANRRSTLLEYRFRILSNLTENPE